MFHRIAIWRVFVTLAFSTFSTKSPHCGRSWERAGGKGGSRSVGLATVDSSEAVIDRLTAPRLFQHAAGGALSTLCGAAGAGSAGMTS